MAESFYTILTNAGIAAFANAQVAQTSVDFANIAVGDSNGAYYTPVASATSLVNEVWSGPINSISIDETNPNWIIVEAVIPAIAGGFSIREIGVLDSNGVLLAIGKVPETYKPDVAQGSSKDLYLRIILEVSNASVVNLKVDPAVIFASRKYVDDKFNSIKNNVDNINTELQELNLSKAYSGLDFETTTDGYSSDYSGLRFRPLQDYILKSVQVKSVNSGEIGIEIYKVYDNTNFDLYYSKTVHVNAGITTLELDCYIEVGNYDYLIVKNVDSNIGLAYISGSPKFTDEYNQFKGSFRINGGIELMEKALYEHFFNWTLDLSINKNMRRVESKLNEHLADFEYQTPTIVGTQIRLTKQSDSKRLFFKLASSLSGNITISLDSGATQKPLLDNDGTQVSSIDKGFAEVVEDTTFFTLRSRGISGADLQALITIVNEAERNESDLKTQFVQAVNAVDIDGGIDLPTGATWSDILAQVPNIKTGKKWASGSARVTSFTLNVSGLGFSPNYVITRAKNWAGNTDGSVATSVYGDLTSLGSIANVNLSTGQATPPQTGGFVRVANGFRIGTGVSDVDYVWIAFE